MSPQNIKILNWNIWFKTGTPSTAIHRNWQEDTNTVKTETDTNAAKTGAGTNTVKTETDTNAVKTGAGSFTVKTEAG